MGDHAGALEAYERALAIQRAALGDGHAKVGSMWAQIGLCRSGMGDYTGALEAYERALAIERAALGDHHDEVGSTWAHIGVCRSSMGDYAGALEPLCIARDTLAFLLSPNHRQVTALDTAISVLTKAGLKRQLARQRSP